MKIEEIKLPKPYYRSRISTAHCSETVRLFSTSVFTRQKSKCDRYATFLVDGVALCTQHAGKASLKYLLDKQKTDTTEKKV